MQRLIETGNFYNQYPVKRLERFLARDLKDPISKAMYPLLDSGCPVQLGALGDSFDEIELHTKWAQQAIPLFRKYRVPVRIGTKGGRVLCKPEYLRLFENDPDMFWFAFSCISNSDDLLRKVDIGAPSTTERLAAMKALTALGCKASLRLRPYLPGISDEWETLIERAHEAGSRAISFEFIFLNPAPSERQKALYKLMFRAMKRPHFDKEWFGMSNSSESCRRGSRNYKYDVTMKVRKKVLSLGWNFGISDPHFKELNTSGSCCGFSDDDPWFGKYSRRQLTEVIVDAKKNYDAGTPKQYTYNDWKPEWAHQIRTANCISLGDWHTHRKLKNQTFGDIMRNKWNNPKHPRSPYMYFGGVLRPIGKDKNSGDLVYEYRPWDPKFDEEFKGE
jgi:DNA repair photolyase